jgi:hypothetical protein
MVNIHFSFSKQRLLVYQTDKDSRPYILRGFLAVGDKKTSFCTHVNVQFELLNIWHEKTDKYGTPYIFQLSNNPIKKQ